MGSADNPAQFSVKVAGVLSDMDGTLVDSTKAVVKFWHSVAHDYGLEPEAILATSHGRRAIDTFRTIDPALATWDYVNKIEEQIPKMWRDDARIIPGAPETLSSLESCNAKWGVVTSATKVVVDGWFKIFNLPDPKFSVTAEVVEHGKPHPEPYQKGLKSLGVDEKLFPSVLVLEDAPAGVRSGKEAGCLVLALATSHSVDELKKAGADWIVPDLRSVKISKNADVELSLDVQMSDLYA